MLQNNISTWQTVSKEKIIYDYLRENVTNHSFDEVAIEFRLIFLEGRSQNSKIQETIEQIVTSQVAKDKFFYLLNYCFYILIDCWFDSEIGQQKICQLLAEFADANYEVQCYNRRRQKVLALTKAFLSSKYYARLKRIAIVIKNNPLEQSNDATTIDLLAPRYTYLYKPLLIGKENIAETARFIRELQSNRSKSFEFKLAQHVIYRSRLIEVAKAKQFSHGAGKIIRRVPNPTLLSDRDLRVALKQYIKKLDGKLTLCQTARKFVLENSKGICYGEFKQNLYQYLVENIEPKNNQYSYHTKLRELIDNAYYQFEGQEIGESLILQTCRKLYQSLIVNNAEKTQHHTLIKLIQTLGTGKTVMLLIKILLICPKAKPDLEQRLAILFAYYEDKSIAEVPWLAKFLEHFLVAFSIYFGKLDISLGKTL